MTFAIKISTVFLMGLLLTAFTSAAETQYVTEDLTITLRTGPGKDRKIIAFPKAGTPLEVVTPGEEYTEVQMSNGKQGYVLTRFITRQVPADIVLAQLQKKYDRVVQQYEEVKNRAANLNTESKDLVGELTSTQKALDKLTHEHETLKKESQEFLQLKSKYDKAAKDAASARARADKVEKENRQLISSQLNTGLLYGGGLIVFGFIVGFIVKRPKRRAPLL